MAVEQPKHQELLVAPEALAELEVERAEEIVALVCIVNPSLDLNDPAVKLLVNRHALEVAKAGTKPFKMRPDKFLKMKRADAEWHVAKVRRNDLTNPLMLVIKNLDEIKGGGKAPAAATYHEKLIAQAIKERLITQESDAENVSDDELAKMLKSTPTK